MIVQKDEIGLRKLINYDEESLTKLANNKKIWDNLRDYFPHPYTIDHAKIFIDSVANEDPPFTFGITFQTKLCGVISLIVQTDIYRKTAELGYWIGEPFWGNGIASTAVELICKYGFNKLDIVRIEAAAFDFNKASMRVLEKNGFQKEGIAKNGAIKNDQLFDEYRYALLKSE